MKVSYRQISIMTFLSFIALKMLVLPSLLYVDSGNMTWLVTLILMIIDAIYAFIILGLIKKNQNKNVLQFMTECLGPVLSRIILFILLIKYALVIGILCKSLELFVVENFYSELEWYLFIIPLIIVVGFMVYKGIRNIGRVSEMFCWAIILGMLYIALHSISQVEIFEFLPMFKGGVKPLFTGAINHLGWFGSSTFLLVLFGKVDFQNEKKFQMLKYILISIVLVQIMYFVFIGLFGITSPTFNFCLSDISQFSVGGSATDELSWLVVSLWVVVQIIQLALFGYCFCQALKFTFNLKSNVIAVLILDIYLFFWGYIGEKTIDPEAIFLTKYASVVTIIAEYIVPLLLLIGYYINKRKDKRKQIIKKVVNFEKIKNNI